MWTKNVKFIPNILYEVLRGNEYETTVTVDKAITGICSVLKAPFYISFTSVNNGILLAGMT